MTSAESLARRLFFFDGLALFIGHISDTTPHAHYAHQLCLAVPGRLALRACHTWARYRSVLIPSNLEHQLRVDEGGVALLYVDPSGVVGEQLASRLSPDQPHPLETDLNTSIAMVRSHLAMGCESEQAHHLVQTLLADLDVDPALPSERDPRIQRTLRRLDDVDGEAWDLHRLADAESLSSERLRHLFRNSVGIPIRSYKTWARIRRAAALLGRRGTLTEAAHEAGFSDSAHLSRTFRRLFGIVPSGLLGR